MDRAGHPVIGRALFDSPAPPAVCQRILEQDTESQTAPDEQVGTLPSAYECVAVTIVVKCFEQSVEFKNAIETIYH